MNTAEVYIWDQLVGAVVWEDRAGLGTFEYDPSFVEQGWDLSPLQMPLNKRQRIFSFPALRVKPDSQFDAFKGLPGLLADSLPDRYGNELINLWLSKQGRPANSMNPVEMLCFMGSRSMGALEFKPTMLKERNESFALEIDSMVSLASELLEKKEAFVTNLKEDEEEAVKQILRIGTSAGGARPKAVIAYNEKTGAVKSGQAKVPKNFEHWLIKLDGVSEVQLGSSHGYGRVEMAYYLMAKECGINMMPSKLLEENGRAHFMTKRFDREKDNQKIHIQSFCAIKHFDFNLTNSFSYEQLFQTMRELKLPYPDAEQMFRRMVFNVLARNCDDHTKNFSFLMEKDGKWHLSPAYDLCHAYRPDSLWVSQHALSINGKRKNILFEDLMRIGKSIKVQHGPWEEIIDEVNTVVRRWRDFADQTKVNPVLREQIAKTLIHF